MKKFNLMLLILVLCYSCLNVIVLVRILHDHSAFYPTKGKWKLIWEDDFNSPVLDQNKWVTVEQSINPRKEIQVFLHQNITIKDGCLVIASKKEDWVGADKIHPNHVVTRHYTSGEVGTWEKSVWKYGRFEIRAKLPAGQGLEPYIVLYPNDNTWPPEIDIMVMYGHQPDTLYFLNHWGADAKHHYTDSSGPVSNEDYSVDFHTFALEWENRKLQWYVDNVQKYQVNRNIPDKPLCLVIGTAVGGIYCGNPYNEKFGGRPSLFPQYLMIDWIRVFQRR